jgi:hypothetical protein
MIPLSLAKLALQVVTKQSGARFAEGCEEIGAQQLPPATRTGQSGMLATKTAASWFRTDSPGMNSSGG